MNNNKKIIAAAALAAVIGLTGCSTDRESTPASFDDFGFSSTTASYEANVSNTSDGTSSEETVSSEPTVSSDSSEISKSETDSSEIGGSETDNSVSAPAESSTESTSDSNDYADRLHELFGDKTVGEIMAEAEAEREKTSIADKRNEEEKLVDALIDELKLNDNKKSDMEKLCILGKWFCDNTEYDHALAEGIGTGLQTEASYLLTKHSGKCSSYAKAACLILSECGIDTLYCSNANINHAWNAVKIDGQWTYTDFTGGPDTLILGSSRLGLPKYTVISWHSSLHGYGYSGAKPDISEISSDLRLFDFDGNELEVHEEADGFSSVDSNGKSRKTTF